MLLRPDQPETAAAAQDEFEWVNAWAAQGVAARESSDTVSRQANVVSLRIVSEASEPRVPEGGADVAQNQIAAPGSLKKARDHQVVLDIVAIIRARDALFQGAPQKPMRQTFDAIPLRGHRTADSVPLILGSVMGLLMIIVFSTAAAFVKLAR